MLPTLRPGLAFEFRYTVPETKTVPHVFSESERFRAMPRVFATAYLVGLLEWACIEALAPHLEAGEQSVGTDIRVTHEAATPPGFTVTVQVRVEEVEGRRVLFAVSAHDGVDTISRGTHQRFVIDAARFGERLARKASAVG
jgi:fluoroacetyl-CoA thioesterase